MRLSLEWLNDYIDVTLDEVLEKLPKLGIDIDDHGPAFPVKGPIVVGKVEKVERHPGADRLFVCRVNVGDGYRTLLTTDSKVETGSFVFVALPGAVLANGNVVEAREMRGIESEGMLCSLEELGLAEKSDRVFTTFEPLTVGADVIHTLKLDAEYFETDVTPNRGDCLSYFGIARELSAGLGRPARYPIPRVDARGDDFVPVEIRTTGCWRYSCRVIRGVRVQESPLWLRRRLVASGLRPINNIVDITNYVMLETGHPVHAFDLAKLSGKIVVRDAEPGEKMVLLDGKEYQFHGGEVLITDGHGPVALGGIMGGEESGISWETRDILLEVAMFDPIRIRRTSRRLGVSSDSSYRFERGVDFEDNLFVVERLSELIAQIAGGEPSKTMVDVYPTPVERRVIFVPKGLPKKILGVELKNVDEYLTQLGFEVEEASGGFEVHVPSFRYFDVSLPEDVVEEIGRIHGYDRLSPEPPRLLAIERGRSERASLRLSLKNLMTGLGYNEANTMSFVASRTVELLPFAGQGVPLRNPIVSEFDRLRPSILYGLLEALSYNYKRQMREVKLFEIGKIFRLADGEPVEEEALAFVATGRETPRDYTDKRRVSFYTFKGAIDEVLEHLGVTASFQPCEPPGLSPTRSVRITVGNDVVGFAGMLELDVADRIYDVKDEVYVCEMYLERLLKYAAKIVEYKQIPQFPYVRRDVSYLVPVGFETSKLLAIYLGHPLVEEVGVEDVFKLDDEHYSVTVYAKFRDPIKTLSDEEVDEALEGIKRAIIEKFGVKLRY